MTTEDPKSGKRSLVDQAARTKTRYAELWQAATCGQLPAVKVGSRWFCSDGDVDAYLASRAGEAAGATR